MLVDELEKKLKEGNLDSLYLLYGEETYLIDTILKKIKKNFGELVKGINYIIIDKQDVSNIISNIQTPAFGYEKKLIILNNTNLLKKENKKNNILIAKEREKLEEYIENNIEKIKSSNVIVFLEDTLDKVKLKDIIEKNGVICNFERLNILQLTKKMKSICNSYKVNASEDALKYLIETSGTNMQDLINEIRKLIEYTGENGTLTKESIDKLTTKQLEYIIFDLTDNLGSKKIKNSIEIFRELIKNKEPVQKILITLYNHFKKLYIIKIAEIENKKIAESLELKPNQIFLVSKYKKQAEMFEKESLKNILYSLIELDSNYKSGKIDLNLGLESILCNYCS